MKNVYQRKQARQEHAAQKHRATVEQEEEGQALAPPGMQLQASGGDDPVVQRWGDPTTADGRTISQVLADMRAQAAALAKANFLSRNYGPITYTRGNIIGSGFEASYSPSAGHLNVLVRGKYRFADTVVNNGGTFSSPNHFMNQSKMITVMNLLPPEAQARVLPYFQWDDTQKQIHTLRFQQNIDAVESVWQNAGHTLVVNETGYEDVTATPNININMVEGERVRNTTTEHFGPFGAFSRSVTDESTSDHFVVEIVKQPTPEEVSAVLAIVNTELNNALAFLGPAGIPLINALMPNAGDVAGVRSYLGNDPQSDGEEGFNNFMSLESDRADDPSNRSYSIEVFFENNESDLSPGEQARLQTIFSDPTNLMQNGGRDVDIELEGYASAVGSSSYNSELVNRRLSSVDAFIAQQLASSEINEQTHLSTLELNHSDADAEAAETVDPTTYDPSHFRKVSITVNRTGRGGQNVLAHEFGHVFGLDDEYVEVGNGYNRPAGTLVDHDQLVKDAGLSGGAAAADDSRMMSTGNNVQPEHYATFADALRQLTSKSWHIQAGP